MKLEQSAACRYGEEAVKKHTKSYVQYLELKGCIQCASNLKHKELNWRAHNYTQVLVEENEYGDNI